MTHAGITLIAAYDVRLVFISVLIAIIASYTALDLAGRVTQAQGRVRKLWLAGGAIAMGISIWSMHFIGMLAYELPTPMTYELPIVLLSVVVAVIVSGVALFLASRQTMGRLPLLAGGVFMGLGIASMHYIGMAAMRLEATAQYDLKLVAVSIVIAIGASLISLYLAFQLRAETIIAGSLSKLGSALIMGNAIAGMHYTAMAAVSFKQAFQLGKQLFQGMDTSKLAVAIGLATLVILALALLASLVDRRISAQTTRTEALRQSEERFRSLVQHSSDIIKILEADGTICYQSPSIERILGYKPEDLIGKNAFEYLHPDDFITVQAAFDNVIQKSGVAVRAEYRFRHANTSWVYLESVAKNLLSDINIKGVVINSRDITERKQAEEVLLRMKVTEAAKQQLEEEITERKRAEVALRQQTERERLLSAIIQQIRQSLNLDEILNSTVTAVRQLLQTDRMVIYRREKNGNNLVVAESVGSSWSSILGSTVPEPWFKKWSTSARQGETYAIHNIQQAAEPLHIVEEFHQQQVKAVLATPIFQGDMFWGLLVAHQCSEPRHWQPIEINLLEQLATQVAIAIQQSELYQQVQHSHTNLERQVQERTSQLQQALDFEAMLKRITDKVRDSLDESQILQTAVQELVLVTRVSCCNTALYNLEQGSSTICYEYATSEPGAQARVAQIANFPEIYQMLLQGEYLQFCSIIPNPIRGRVAMFACPILDDQGVLGDLWLINHQEHAFSDLEIRLVQQVANQCAIAIRQARLYQAATAQVEELEKLNSLKDDFLSTVSHELRTPVSNMKLAIRMLQLAPTAERRENYLKILQNECTREIELINSLLDLQRVQPASSSILREVVSLQDWLPSIIAPFRVRTQERQQILHVDLPGGLPPIISDRVSLGRILAELLNNACKYTPVEGEIALSIRHKQSGGTEQGKNSPSTSPICPTASTSFNIRNSVEIPATELPRIFEKFYRVPSADPWKQGGTGLGLALVQKLVKQMEGTIQVESSCGWTTFTVELTTPVALSQQCK